MQTIHYTEFGPHLSGLMASRPQCMKLIESETGARENVMLAAKTDRINYSPHSSYQVAD